MSDFKFDLGVPVRDKITGFEGVVVFRSQWLHNCNTYGVQPTELKDGAPQKREIFDEPQLELVSAEPAFEESKKKTGGPTADIPQTNREV